MNINKAKFNWVFDVVFFAGFLAEFFLNLTGLELHQWLGIGGGVFAAYHLLLHWNWVKAVTQRFWGRTSFQARTYYLVDAALLAGFVTILFTGLVISSWLALDLGNYEGWRALHETASIVTLLAVVLKVAIHWRWIMSTAQRLIFSGPAMRPQPASPRPTPVAAAPGRREFLKLMGAVGAGAFLAIVGVINEPVQSEVSAASSSAPSESETSSSSSISVASNSSSSGCTVQCQKRCSYPGHCRRYVDSNGNNRCDLGECA